MKKVLLLSLAVFFLCCWGLAIADQTTSGQENSTTTSYYSGPNVTAQSNGPSISNAAPFAEAYKAKLAAEYPTKTGAVPAPPDPNVILQGGDNFASATVIPSLPYTDNGTTVGYTHEYTGTCVSTGTSPDVVYSYTPAANTTIKATLCPSQGWDTGLIIFQNDPSTQVGCNDDFCGTTSEIGSVSVTAGNTYYIVVTGYNGASGTYTLIVTEVGAPQQGDNCSDPIQIPGVPYTDSRNSCDYLNDYHYSGADVIYRLVLAAPMTLNISLCNSPTQWDSQLSVWDEFSCGSTTYIADVDGGCTGDGYYRSLIENLSLDAGTYYIMVDGWGVCAEYTLDITEGTPCVVECPAGGVPEVEDNGGCNSDPPVFDSITDGETVCGTGWEDASLRDTDWYLFTLTDNQMCTLTMTAEFDFIVGFIVPYSSDPCDNSGSLTYYTFGGPCDTVSVSATLGATPGTYVAFVAPAGGIFTDKPYWMTMSMEEPPPPPPNDLCEDATINVLTDGVPVTVTGDNTNALVDCSLLGAGPEVWEAFTITQEMNVMIDFCGTVGYTGGYYWVVTPDCPCSSYLLRSGYDYACPDGNIRFWFDNLPAGTYYIPVLNIAGSVGPYTINMVANVPPPPPANDNCADITPVPLTNGVPLTFTGTTVGTTMDCSVLGGGPEAWEAFTTTEPLKITIDYCGTTPTWTNFYWVVVPDCPCSGFTMRSGYDYTCADGNIRFWFDNLPAGTYYIPVLKNGQGGPYVINVNSETPPPPPENDLCSAAIPVTVPSNTFGTTIASTMDSEFPTCGTGISAGGVWYSVQGTGNTMTATTCNATTTYDSKINVYCYSCEIPVCVTGNDDDCVDFALRSTVNWCSDPTATYLILVQGYGGAIGDFELDVTDDGVPCSDPIVCGVPVFGVNPTSITGNAPVGGTDTDHLNVGNSGDALLIVDSYINIEPPAPLSTLPPAGHQGNSAMTAPTVVKNAVSGSAPKPDQNVILQGGDNIAAATVISALPYNDVGTTAGYTDDYNEVCPYTTTGAPDVVYSYTAPYDQFVDITLCNGSAFDTKLYLYENEYTPGAPFACNDDACPGYASELLGLQLTGGNVYYIVVDGYDAASYGDYVIDMSEGAAPPGCPSTGVLFGQNPSIPTGAWTFATSDVEPGYTAFESFSGLFGEVQEVHFWGIDAFFDGSAWNECDEDPAAINISFWQDAGGLPGELVNSYDVTVTGTPTGQTFSGFVQKEYVVTLPTPTVLFQGWISIQGTSSGDNCWFMWQDSPEGDGNAIQFDGTTYAATGFDFSVCLIGPAITPWLSIDQSHFEIPAGGAPQLVTVTMDAATLAQGTYHGSVFFNTNEMGATLHEVPVTFTVGTSGVCNYLKGDINNNGAANGIDVVYGVVYFKGGPVPPVNCASPSGPCSQPSPFYAAGDVNGNCSFNGIDITFFVNYLKGIVPALLYCPSCPPTNPFAPGVINPTMQPTKVNIGANQQ